MLRGRGGRKEAVRGFSVREETVGSEEGRDRFGVGREFRFRI